MKSICCILVLGLLASLPSCSDGVGGDKAAPKVLVVGTGVAGFADSPNPQFNKPIRLTPYGSDSILVADIFNHAIRIVDIRGQVTTLSGAPDRKGHKDGLSSQAQFDSPHGVAVSEGGLIAVAEASNHTIRLLEPVAAEDGSKYRVTTLAGVPKKSGILDGNASTALFSSPHAVVWSKSLGFVVCDIGNSRIRAIKNGVVTTLSGGVKANDETFKYPMDLTLSQDGSIFMVDAGFMSLFKQPEGQIPTVVPLDLPLKTPHGICRTPEDDLIVAEMGSHDLVLIKKEGGSAQHLFGEGKAGSGANQLNKPAAVLVHAGKLWIADLENHQIKIVDWPLK